MSEPVDRFCEMIAVFEPKDRQEIVDLVCLAAGCPEKPTGVVPTKDTLLSELHHPHTVDDLRKRLNLLADRMDIWPVVLMSGLFHMLTDHYDRLADPSNVAEWIDRCLAERQALEAEVEKPLQDRTTGLTDDRIRRKIEAVEMIMTSSASRRQKAERLGSQIREEWDRRYPTGYWYAWLMQHLRDTMPPCAPEAHPG